MVYPRCPRNMQACNVRAFACACACACTCNCDTYFCIWLAALIQRTRSEHKYNGPIESPHPCRPSLYRSGSASETNTR